MSGGTSPVATHSTSASGSEGNNSGSEGNHSTGPRKKRKRPKKISCELCKSRKVKCDRREPSCGWCARHDRVCVYQERKKPGLGAGYGRELEGKIDRLEAMLQVLGRRVEDHIIEHQPSNYGPVLSSYQSESFATPQGDPLLARVESEPQIAPPSASSWSDANAYERLRPLQPLGPTSVPSTGDTNVPNGLVQQGYMDSAISTTPYDGNSVPFDSDLPPPDLLYTLVDLYFKHVNPWSPILDRKETLDTLFGSSLQDEADRILLHAIVAVTLRFSRDSRLTGQARKHYYSISKQKIQIYGLDHPGVRALQALVILTVDIIGTSNAPQAWNMLALIARNLIQLGLGVERGGYLTTKVFSSTSATQAFALAQPKSWIEDEGRRRLFWIVYILDRYATLSTSSNFVVDEQETDRMLPCRYDLFSNDQPVETRWFRWMDRAESSPNKPENLGSFSYHCEVLGILSRIHEFLRQPLDISSLSDVRQWRENYQNLDSELSTWLQNLPGEYGKISQLCHSDPGSRISNWIMLHAAFVIAVIRLHSSAGYPIVRSQLFVPSYNAMQRCLAAVESLREIALDVVKTNMLDLLGPPFAFALWVSARLLLVQAAALETRVDPKIGFFISTLEQMGEYWKVAHVYAETLDRIVNAGQTNEPNNVNTPMSGTNNNHNSPNVTSNPSNLINTFTAMRRSAHEITLLLSRLPPKIHDQPIVKTPTETELEYFHVFDFFNRPFLPAHLQHLQHDFTSSTTPQGGYISDGIRPENDGPDLQTMSYSATPGPETDWLNFRPPYE